MNAVFVVHRADLRQQVHDLGLQRKPLADTRAGNAGLDRRVHPAILGRRIRLHIVGILLAHTAVSPEDDN